MKHLLRTLLVLAPVVLSAQSSGVIKASKHDLSSTGANGGYFTAATLGQQICVYCHTPHNALKTNGPLWNRSSSSAVYTMYGTTLRGTATAGTPGAASLSCLSCHDGTVAMWSLNNTYLGTANSSNVNAGFSGNISKTTGLMTGQAMVGPNLTNDHPVSIAYPAAGTSGYVTAVGSTVGTYAKLYSNQVECASCHDVHAPGQVPFLRMSNAASALCNACHVK